MEKKSAVTTERANFESEIVNALDSQASEQRSSGDVQCAEEIAASVERIVGGDAEFISSLEVPEDIISIDDVDQLRQLLALCSQDIGVILELCRREPLGRAVVLSGLPLRFPDGLRLVLSLRGEASPELEPGVSVLQIRRGLEVLADGLPGALRRRHCLRGLEALRCRHHSPRGDRYSFPSPSSVVFVPTAEAWHTKAVVPAVAND